MAKKAFLSILICGATALSLCACTTTRVAPRPDFFEPLLPSDKQLFPGYRPNPGESFGALASWSDMLGPPEFLHEACGDINTEPKSASYDPRNPATLDSAWRDETQYQLETPSKLYVLTVSSGGGGSSSGGGFGSSSSSGSGGGLMSAVGSTLGGLTGGATGSSSSSSSGAGASGAGGGFSVSLAPRGGIYSRVVTVAPDLDPDKHTPVKVDGKVVTTTTIQTTRTISSADFPDSADADSSDTDGDGAHSKPDAIGITTCSIKVLNAAVSICNVRSSNRDAFDEFLNNSLSSGLAVGGAAAGIAALLRASGRATTVIGGGALLADGILGGVQKSVPPLGQAQMSSVISAGLTYLATDQLLTRPLSDYPQVPDKTVKIDKLGADKEMGSYDAYEASYAHLFDAAMTSCTVANQ